MFIIDKNLLPTVVTHEAFSLGSLIAWLETKNPREKYSYTCNGNCLIAQYFKAHDSTFRECTPDEWTDKYGNDHPLPPHYDAIALASGSQATFGAALGRAREYAGRAQ